MALGIAQYIVLALTFGFLISNIVVTIYWKWTNIINFNVVVQTIRPRTSIGLWRICRESFESGKVECANIDPMNIPSGYIPSWVNAVRALMIFSCLANFTSLLITFYRK